MKFSSRNGRAINRKLILPKLDDMLPQQIKTLKDIAFNHQKSISLMNGLVVYPDGSLDVRHQVARRFNAMNEYQSLLKRIRQGKPI